jgi:hypothetical protein
LKDSQLAKGKDSSISKSQQQPQDKEKQNSILAAQLSISSGPILQVQSLHLKY